MNLSLTDLRRLPLASALIGGDGEVIASTPEWRGTGPGAAAYPVRSSHLVVCVEPAAPRCTELLRLLLDELNGAAASLPKPQSLVVRMLATSLQLVCGRVVVDADVATAEQVLHTARLAIEARTGLHVNVEPSAAFAVRGGDAAALVLVQLAANAERHSAAREVTLASGRDALSVSWRGDTAGRYTTARRHDDRARWGMGFARIAADSIAAVVHAPHPGDNGWLSAMLELHVGRLSLPLAVARNHRIHRATRAWDEETGALPGTPISALPGGIEACAAAMRMPEALVRHNGLTARAMDSETFLAVPPDDVADRARDVIDGLTHEWALVDNVAEPRRSRINALAQLLGFVLGAPIQRVPAAAWSQRMRELAQPFALRMPIPEFAGLGATDPAVCALLAAEAGETFETDGESLWLRLRGSGVVDPVALPLLGDGTGLVRLG
ncbi:MAG: hypothetical protein JOY80_04555 [Candidatus Dormibacteraeota bacterium]|nr:hypothetical protein [Candidatus Dormibacteraeota bacterium]